VANRIDDFRRLGVEIVAVSMSRPEALATYLKEKSLPFPIVADPERTAYAAFGLGRTSWSRILRAGVIWRYMKLIFRGGKVRRVAEGEDALQTGGDFLIDGERRLIWGHTSADPTDRPTVEEILGQIKTGDPLGRPLNAKG
jgi:hypothetical protein